MRFSLSLAALAISAGVGVAAVSEDGAVGLARVQSAQLPEDPTLGVSFYNRLVNTPGLFHAFNQYIGDRAVDQGVGTDTKLFASDHTLGMYWAAWRSVELNFALPVYYQDLALDNRQLYGTFIGDARIGLTAAHAFGSGNKPWAVAVQFGGTLPTSEPGDGVVVRHLEETPENAAIYARGSRAGGDHRGDMRTGLALTYDLTKCASAKPFSFSGNAFVRTTSPFVDRNHDFYDVWGYGLSAEWHATSWLTPFAQFAHEGRIESDLPDGADLTVVGLGGQARLPYGLALIAGGEWAIGNDDYIASRYAKEDGSKPVDYSVKGVPDASVYLAVTWEGKIGNLDPDLDGIKGSKDKCPLEAEDKDGFQDEDGCPDADNDGDGISDLQDKCPLEAEDKDGFEDADGCRDGDNDKDGMVDSLDKCPDAAEDVDGFEDADGCPELDNDKDGVPDAQDKCPLEPQGDKGKDGCAFKDGDADGVADWDDKCPNEKETVNGFQDRDGCADKAPVEEKKLVLQGVNFETAKAILTPPSLPVLDTLATQLTMAPAIHLEVSGHTDNSGNAAKNQKLSQDRAQAVADYLITKGVAKERLTVKGYGSAKPVGDNKTAEGKAQNRRVEFNRTK